MTTVENLSLSTFYETIIENAESNILILDKEFSIVSLNPGFYWVFLEAYDIHLKKGERLFEVMHTVAPAIADRWRIRCMAALKGLSISDEEEFESHGQTFSWKIYYKSLTHGGEPFVSIYSRNITADKQFQNKILQHESNLRAIINSFNSCIWLLNERFELVDFNDRTFAHFLNALNVTLLPSKNFIELLPEEMHDLRQRWTDRLNAALFMKAKNSHHDHFNVHGAEMICETRIIPVLSEERVIGLTISMKDITQRRMDEMHQRDQLSELHNFTREFDKFVQRASNDLRAPLLSIIGVLNIMKRESPNDHPRYDQIESTVKKIDHVIANIISYSTQNKLASVVEEIDLKRTISSVIDSISYLNGSHILKCIEIAQQDIPFFSDKASVSTILRNTFSNTLVHLAQSERPDVEILIRMTNDFAEIEMKGGTLVPQGVFKSFFQGSEIGIGSGLGLYIVRNTINKLGGRIYIDSDVQEGQGVTITLPNHFRGSVSL